MKINFKILRLSLVAIALTLFVYSCSKDNSVETVSVDKVEEITLYQLDKMSDTRLAKIPIAETKKVDANLRSNLLLGKKERILKTYIDNTSKDQAFLMTKSVDERGLYLTLAYPVKVMDDGRLVFVKGSSTPGCSSTVCTSCDPTVEGGVIVSCDCDTANKYCKHVRCKVINGVKNCCTSRLKCESCKVLHKPDGSFDKCECDPTTRGACAHSATMADTDADVDADKD